MLTRPSDDDESYASFTACYDDLVEPALRRAARLLVDEARLSAADADDYVAAVFAELYKKWKTEHASRTRSALRKIIYKRLRWRIATAASRRRDEPREDLTLLNTDGMTFAEPDEEAVEAAHRYIESLPEPDRSILLYDEDAIRRLKVPRSSVYRIRERLYARVTARDLWGAT